MDLTESADIINQLLPDIENNVSLYHYTTQEGLLGMIKTRKLWCSQIFYLNDLEENINIWKYFFKGIKEWKNDSDRAEAFRKTVDSHLDHYKIFDVETISIEVFKQFKISDYLLFAFSFSHVGDDLSQWRAYTGAKNGYSLKFRHTDNFLTGQPHFHNHPTFKKYNCKILIKDCVYDDTRKGEIIKGLLDHTFKSFLANTHHWYSNLFFNLLTLGIFFKNKKFEAEKECRMAILPFDYAFRKEKAEDKFLQFRNGSGFLIPYIELDITQNFLTEIMVGPTAFPDHALASTKMMINHREKDLLPIAFDTSKCPFRYW